MSPLMKPYKAFEIPSSYTKRSARKLLILQYKNHFLYKVLYTFISSHPQSRLTMTRKSSSYVVLGSTV